MEVAKLIVVQKLADTPKEAKVKPIFLIIGCNESLNLLSNNTSTFFTEPDIINLLVSD
jgi:hypothetical protein